VLLALGLFLLVDGMAIDVVEPLFYAASTGIAPLVLLLVSAFRALPWGSIGLILAPALNGSNEWPWHRQRARRRRPRRLGRPTPARRPLPRLVWPRMAG
jgi:hypothetical protein